jgi:protein gp37
MAETTGIAWTDHTFNPWWGCTKVSPGCKNCYADTLSSRYGFDIWGPDKPRRFFSDQHWREPLKWEKRAAREGVRERVFCASMADVFEDNVDLLEHRARLFDLIEATPHLDWQLLTKRPENVARLVPREWNEGRWPGNVWIGASAEDQARLVQRMAHLARLPAPVRFLSCEPLLGPLDLLSVGVLPDWVIVGGESGPGARPFNVAWARSLRSQAHGTGIAFFMKQFGARPVLEAHDARLNHRKGEDPSEWPLDLRVQEFPEPRMEVAS